MEGQRAHCPNCHSPVGEGRFCAICGASLTAEPSGPVFPRACSKCGAVGPLSSQFCYRCGSDLAVQAPADIEPLIPPAQQWTPAPPPPMPTPRRRSSTGALVIIIVVLLAIFLIIVAMFPSWTSGGSDAAGIKPGDPTFKWVYHGTTYRMDINISKAVYQQYHLDSVQRYATDDAEAVQLADLYVTSGEDLITEMSIRLSDATEGFTDINRVNFVLSFVQTIEYVTDEESVGQIEYWRYPVETLYEHQGDCEDKSFLFASLMEAMDYDTVILIFYDHAATGISCEGAKGSYFSSAGEKYYYCETTSIGWEVGDMPEEYNSAHIAPVS